SLFYYTLISPAPSSTLFPYTTLFRSKFQFAGRITACLSLLQNGSHLHKTAREWPLLSYDILKACLSMLDCIENRFSDDEKYAQRDRKSTRLNSSHRTISYAVFCLKKK